MRLCAIRLSDSNALTAPRCLRSTRSRNGACSACGRSESSSIKSFNSSLIPHTMLAAISTLLLATTLVSSAPAPLQKRSAAIIPLPARSAPSKVFNKDLLRNEFARIQMEYGNKTYEAGDGAVAQRKRRAYVKPFDVAHLARRKHHGNGSGGGCGSGRNGSGSDSLTDVFQEGVDNCTMVLSASVLLPNRRRDTREDFKVTYGDQSTALGTIASDVVTVAGLTVQDQGFGAVTSESGNFLSSPSAGLLGLGFPANAESGAIPFAIGLAESGALASEVFSFYMTTGGSDGSELCLGCTNSEKYTGDVKSYPLDPEATKGKQYYWNIKSDGFSYNGGESSGSFSAVIDSGTTLIYIPIAAADALYKSLGGEAAPQYGQGTYTYPCSKDVSKVEIAFGDDKYALNPDFFNAGAVEEGSSTCVGGILGQDFKGANLAIISDLFMKTWYSIFDCGNQAVGFAKAT